MRLSHTLFAFISASTYFIPAALSIHPHVLAHRDYMPPPRSIALRQRSAIHSRHLIDICISLDGSVIAKAAGLLGLLTDVHLCLCLEDLDIFLDTNVDIQLLITLLGKYRVSSIIKTLASVLFIYMWASLTLSRSMILQDPAAADSPTTLIALATIKTHATTIVTRHLLGAAMNCGSRPNGCGSAAPRSLKSRARFISNLEEAQEYCGPKRAVCGVSTEVAFDSYPFECVDLETDPESCGGCMVPHPFHESLAFSGRQGTNCYTQSNVLKASCFDSRCIVNKCKDGWTPNLETDQCVSAQSLVGISSGSSRMKRERRALTSANSNLETALVVNSDFKTRISRFLGLCAAAARNCPPLPPPSNASSLGSPPIDTRLTEVFVNALVSLSTAENVSSLVDEINATANLLASMSISLTGCDCVERLGLTHFSEEIIDLTAKALELQTWCNSHSVIQFASGTPLDLDLTIDLGLSTLLVGPPHAGGVVPTKHNPAGPSSREPSSPSPAPPSSASMVRNSGMPPEPTSPPPPLVQSTSTLIYSETRLRIDAIVAAVTELKSFSPPSADSFDSSLIGSIVETTVSLVTCGDVSELIAHIYALVTICDQAKAALDSCSCGEGAFTDSLTSVVKLAVDLKNWSDQNPVAYQSGGSHLPVPNTCACPYHHGSSVLINQLLGSRAEKSVIGGTNSSFGSPSLGESFIT
ncbi:hypothetical protein BD779DRAFT_1761943 [Infundibulicybe gibba]|nr:hypothetical protein BD779DRAFT_1761943 [Infundibulicybe gibba]